MPFVKKRFPRSPAFPGGLGRGLPPALALILFIHAGCAPGRIAGRPPVADVRWLGLHVMVETSADAWAILTEIPALAGRGVNLMIAEIDYNYAYESHPELRGPDPVSKETIKKIVDLCRAHGIRLIPEFQSLGHQSWDKKTYPLLTRYPEFDETPGLYPENKGIYCRSWCPLHPAVNPIIFDLYDELIEAFEADALHVGMDEVFLIASDHCPRCKGGNPAELFAKAVNDYHGHVVKERGKEMLIWGDRLIDGAATGYGEWEGSKNGTHPAVDMIPRDIIICDWHYEKMPEKAYPSIPAFLNKGFRVLPASYKNVSAAKDLIHYSLKHKNDRMLGHLCTIWRSAEAGQTRKYRPLRTASKMIRAVASGRGDSPPVSSSAGRDGLRRKAAHASRLAQSLQGSWPRIEKALPCRKPAESAGKASYNAPSRETR